MLIGNGLIAKGFMLHEQQNKIDVNKTMKQNKDLLLFASGVSYSKETDEQAFIRERELLLECCRLNQPKRIVYISTCSIGDPELSNSPYIHHKQMMESIVKMNAPSSIIFRLPQLFGHFGIETLNAKTLANFIYLKINAGEHFEAWRYAKRSLIDISDAVKIMSLILNSAQVTTNSFYDDHIAHQTINIANPFSYSIDEIITAFEICLGKKAHYSYNNSGAAYSIDVTISNQFASLVHVSFDDHYLLNGLRQYYK